MTGLSVRGSGASGADRRGFWRETLVAGGVTALPRWTTAPPGEVEVCDRPVPPELAAAARTLARELGVPLSALLLAAHARVLAALSGESEVVTGYLAGGEALPCRVSTRCDSWRALVAAAHRAESGLLAHREVALAVLCRELGVPVPRCEAVLDLTGATRTDLPSGAALCVAVAGGAPALRVISRTDVLDREAADRIAGYHLTALELIATDVEADPSRQTLLSAEERRLALAGFAGPDVSLPDRRVHELFEEVARSRPDAVAAVHRDEQWTYSELNGRANRLARALLTRGVGPEDVVAVVTERNLDWLAAVLAVFKAGAAYLPVEPHFPVDRITRMLTRAACRFVLSEPRSTTTLDQALASLPDAHRLLISAAYDEGHDECDLGVVVGAGQLAYIYFTSGSTGEPKGAMCEHAGFLNHVLAKIGDLGITEDDVVAQVAPQCFDISLWQLVAALLAGGRTLIVEQEAVLDVERFAERLRAGRVSVVQVVPSYLEAVLAYLDTHGDGRRLPALRCVSVTGEALKRELAERFFAGQPQLTLVNAYGLTETSDDTNHEVMIRPPDGDRVPLGRAVQNVHVYVVDDRLAPVPLGAPGEIVFSGVCVGRGYINDPERTARSFMADPHRAGQRLYRSGDHGRWRPDGKLEFLGRRDSQVKVRGFRIEIGEIENALLGREGVRDCAVVVVGEGDGNARLVGFVTGPESLAPEAIRARLGETLPEYMVPSVLHRQPTLPLTGNGKVDRRRLIALAAELDGAGRDVARAEGAVTPTERRLTVAWAKVLGVDAGRIGRRSSFFDLGGTSLSAVKLAVALDRAVSVRDLAGHPVLADLAALIDGRAQRSSGLLRCLADGDGRARAALICFPYAGGNAVSFQPLAAALRGAGLAVYAVELPGHDLTAGDEALAPMADVVERVVTEVDRLGHTRKLLWGHSSGTALALAVARRMTERGSDVGRVFLAAQLPGDAGSRRAMVAELERAGQAEIISRLSADGGFVELGALDAERAEHIAAAYRHDCLLACRWLADALEASPSERLSMPVTVVLAADDPATPEPQESYRAWERVAERVELRELAGGGHLFLRTRPDAAAAAIRECLDATNLFPSRKDL